MTEGVNRPTNLGFHVEVILQPFMTCEITWQNVFEFKWCISVYFPPHSRPHMASLGVLDLYPPYFFIFIDNLTFVCTYRLLTKHKLVNHGVIMSVGFIRHDPTTGDDLQLAIFDQLPQDFALPWFRLYSYTMDKMYKFSFFKAQEIQSRQ